MGIQGGIVEYFAPGDRLTVTSSGSVTGGNMVALVADRVVSVAGATDLPFGVALHNAADGELLTVATEGVWPLKCSTTVTQGQILATTASGQVCPSTTTAPQYWVGMALEDINASASGPVKVRL